MDKLIEKAEIDQRTMMALKVTEIAHSLAKTSRGELTLQLRKGESYKDYRFVLDAVPVSDSDNRKLIKLYYGKESN